MGNEILVMMTPERYLEDRVKQYQEWYNKKAVGCKSKYLNMRALTVAGGALVPVLVNLNTPLIKYATTIISLGVVILVSLESVFHYREQWKNYRSAEQYLGTEKFSFQTRVGPYKGLEDKDAFCLFVERIECAISAENSATLSTMTLASEAREERKKSSGTKQEFV